VPYLTALVLAAFVGYAGAWYLGFIDGNFSLLLFLACVVTGLYFLAERLVFLPQRRAAARKLEDDAKAREAELQKMGITQTGAPDLAAARDKLLMQPWWLDWTAGLFPVILVVFLLRSFLVEPFKIPSGSMIPTLEVGDLILVNKYNYGLKLPVIGTRLTEGRPVARGDVVVFRYPPKPSLDYIKRVIGLPGDEVLYQNKELWINGQKIARDSLPEYFEEDAMRYFKQFEERLPTGEGALKTHRLLLDESRPAFIAGVEPFPQRDQCRYDVQGVRCKVPAGYYFVMGDNRDNSLDSRYWGFVPDANLVGRAFFVWMNFGNLKRIGGFE
jgi:signal peptidase I